LAGQCSKAAKTHFSFEDAGTRFWAAAGARKGQGNGGNASARWRLWAIRHEGPVLHPGVCASAASLILEAFVPPILNRRFPANLFSGRAPACSAAQLWTSSPWALQRTKRLRQCDFAMAALMTAATAI